MRIQFQIDKQTFGLKMQWLRFKVMQFPTAMYFKDAFHMLVLTEESVPVAALIDNIFSH